MQKAQRLRASERRSRAQRGQAMVEYSFLNWVLIMGLCLTLTANVFPGQKNVIDLFMTAYQLYYDSFYFMLNLPIP